VRLERRGSLGRFQRLGLRRSDGKALVFKASGCVGPRHKPTPCPKGTPQPQPETQVPVTPPPPPAPPPPSTPEFTFHVHNTCRDGACGLKVRAEPGLAAAQVGVLYDAAAASVRCQAVGELVTGGEGSNDVWDRIRWNDGVAYVSDLYLDTPGDDVPQPHRIFTASIPRC
jgi:hypothetical protein